jgi:hypothetical protein
VAEYGVKMWVFPLFCFLFCFLFRREREKKTHNKIVFTKKMRDIFDAPNAWNFQYEEMGDLISSVDDVKAPVSADAFATLLEALTGISSFPIVVNKDTSPF